MSSSPKIRPPFSDSSLCNIGDCGVPARSLGKRIRTLLVASTDSSRRAARSTLDFCGRLDVIATALDGEEGVELALSLLPQLIVMEAVIPKLDGLEAAARIQKHFPGARILILTPYQSTPYLVDASESKKSCLTVQQNKLSQQLCNIMRDLFGPCASPRA